MYQPNVYKINIESKKIDLSNISNLIQSDNINLPLISLGFHSFINRTINSMSITNKLQTHNEFYYVVNPFEYKILNYDDSLDILTEKYLNKKIDSSSFYELWEIFYLFDLINNDELICTVIGNNTIGIIDSIINFKQKLNLINKKDKIFNVSINNIELETNNKSLLGIYNIQYPKLIKNYKGEFNITDIKTISQYKKELSKLKTLANLIIGNCKYKWTNIIYKEQESYILILGQIIAALKTQKKDGHFIIKIYDTFTLLTLKLIYILTSCYKSSYIYKPFFSRPTESDKFIICKNFIFDSESDNILLNNNINILESILNNIKSNLYIYDMFPKLILPNDFINQFKFINIKLANTQQIIINDIITYIKENNYFGDKYHMYKNQQINASKWWLLNFFPPSNNLYIKNKEDLHKLLNHAIDKHYAELNKFLSQLIIN